MYRNRFSKGSTYRRSATYRPRSAFKAPRTYRSRDTSDGGWSNTSTRTIARKAARVANRVMAIENATKQVYQTSDQWVITGDDLKTGPLNLVEEGGGEGERIGGDIMGKGLHVKGSISLYDAPEAIPWTRRIRVMVTLSQLINGTHIFAADDILKATALGTGTWDMAIYNRDKVGKTIKVLYDEVFTISDQNMVVNFDFILPVPYRTTLVNSLGKDACYQNVLNIHGVGCLPIGALDGSLSCKYVSNYTYFTA